MAPEVVGNRRRVLVSDQAGKSNLVHELERLGIAARQGRCRASRGLLDEVKAREAVGYAYEGADASFELLARRLLGEVPQFFSRRQLPRHGREAPQRAGQAGHRVGSDREGVHRRRRGAAVVGGGGQRPRQRARPGAAQGPRPLPASHIQDVELVDYKVRILTGGTEAVTRVLVESRDKATGERWFTVGVSPNIVDASFEALIELDHLQAAEGRGRSARMKSCAAKEPHG